MNGHSHARTLSDKDLRELPLDDLEDRMARCDVDPGEPDVCDDCAAYREVVRREEEAKPPVSQTIYQVYESWTDYDGWKRSEPMIILTTSNRQRAIDLVAADGFKPYAVGAESSSKPQGTRGDLMNRSIREVEVLP